MFDYFSLQRLNYCVVLTNCPGCSEEDPYGYHAQRWLWSEDRQLRRRSVRFDLDGLVRVAEEAAGKDSACVIVT